MAYSPQESYQATEAKTATPQKLQLMLIEGALLMANRAKQMWNEGRNDMALKSLLRAQKILSEMMIAVDLDNGGDLVKRVLAIYEYIYRNLVLAGYYRDEKSLANAIRVLECERNNWRTICEKLAPDDSHSPSEEYRIPTPHVARSAEYASSTPGGFSIEA
jgi:flagellar protein FliS